jgi:Pyruvate/2-oxoacid:ferredoxin oxidoreductase gamma subunit
VLVAFNQPSLDKFSPTVVPRGTVLYDSAVTATVPPLQDGVRAVGVPFTQIAADLGKKMVKNVVALGALQAATGLFPAESFLAVMRSMLQTDCALLELNEEAFAQGGRAFSEAATQAKG